MAKNEIITPNESRKRIAKTVSSREGFTKSKDIAQAMGVTEAYISTRMTGKVEWTLQDLSNMAKIFHMTDYEILSFVKGV